MAKVQLRDRLFSRRLLVMVKNRAAAKARGEKDYENIISAIAQEALALISEANAGRMDKAEAYALLGLSPEAPAAEISRVYHVLLQLWQPDGDEDAAAQERSVEVRQAYTFLQQNGYV